MEQVITIKQDGSVETLRAKKGHGLDLREFGETKMERVSEVLLDEGTQKYYVKFLTGALAGRLLTRGLYAGVMELDFPINKMHEPELFAEYEDGVEAEVAVLNFLSLNQRLVDTALKLSPLPAAEFPKPLD